MGVIRETILETREDRKTLEKRPAFAPAGQSTQLIIGASPESDYDILHVADRLYQDQALKRVYYSGYVPINAADPRLPELAEPPLARENRLYQADWLMRLYGYSVQEVIRPEEPYLDLKIDPKLAFALRQPDLFPVDINSADYAMVLKVPGIGLRSAKRIVSLRSAGAYPLRTPAADGGGAQPRQEFHCLPRPAQVSTGQPLALALRLRRLCRPAENYRWPCLHRHARHCRWSF
ncbi:MAG: hypothetical protein MZV70_71960 [Desulfobacterales bacterium]|nr:hypothetical protein [Desulfobacterales bacterium]